MNDQIDKQNEISKDKVDEYISYINHYKNEKTFPSTLTSLLFNSLTIHAKYDEAVTIPILNATRHNIPFKNLLLIDVYKYYLVDGILADEKNKKEEFVI